VTARLGAVVVAVGALLAFAGTAGATRYIHPAIDEWNPRDDAVKLLRIVGKNQRTFRQVREYWKNCGRPLVTGCTRTKAIDFQTGGGDGTVPLNSADLCNTTNGFDLRGGAPDAYASREHLELVQTDAVLAKALSYFRGKFDPKAGPCGSVGQLVRSTASARRAAAAAPVARGRRFALPGIAGLAAGLAAGLPADAAGAGVANASPALAVGLGAALALGWAAPRRLAARAAAAVLAALAVWLLAGDSQRLAAAALIPLGAAAVGLVETVAFRRSGA
jgi:hypothetical protein